MGIYGGGLYGAGLYSAFIRLSFNPIRNEIFASVSSVLTYVLDKIGLTAISTQIDDVVYNKNELIIHSPAVIVQDNITFSTDIINFKTQGLKAIEWINLEGDIADDVFVTVRYRDSIKDAFVSAPQKQFNNEGACHIGVRGVDFILDFSIPAYTAMHLTLFTIGVQFVDRRFRRGINVANIR